MSCLIITILLLAATSMASATSTGLAKTLTPANSIILSIKDVDVASDGNVIQNGKVLIATKNNLRLGKKDKGDILLAKATYIKKPCRNKIHVQDIIVKGQPNVCITAIQVTPVGNEKDSVASIKEGGIGKNFVVIRLQSAKGGGYKFIAEVWGVKNKNKVRREKFDPLILIP